MIRIRFKFYGGAQEVGRSCILIDSKNYKIMLDCGIKIFSEIPEYPSLPTHVDSFILSHAHLDHSGNMPVLYKKCFCDMYSTDISFELSHMLQRDSLKVSLQNGIFPMYDYEDIKILPMYEKSIPYKKLIDLNNRISFQLYNAGHIPGSASILLEIEENNNEWSVLYTGDIKTVETRLLKGAEIPDADILIMESTYGNRTHPDRGEMEKMLIDGIERTLDRGGNAIVSAFALGRTQEILMILKNMEYPIFLDGMGTDITRLFLQYPEYLKNVNELERAIGYVEFIDNKTMRDNAIREPSIIVTTAGMLNGGPVIKYLKIFRGDTKSSIFLTGYQVKGTNGRLLMDRGYIIDPYGNEVIKIGMEKYYLDFSAHAGRLSLEKIVKKVNPEICILVHGEPESCYSLGNLTEKICKTYIPKVGDVIDIP